MTAKKENATRTSILLRDRHKSIAQALAPTLVGGLEEMAEFTKLLIDAAAAGDKSAIKWLAKVGIETSTASDGATIVIRRDGSIGGWIF